ncbi:MAG: TetR/AcrR family transcriptional regulator [Kaistella sp.]|jgi:AcrR family transcriptional regulator|nr:TetR/AcrR family transcriptional regulator [Kaistella sp.]MBP7982799.1 TetR/AcrR family transcriptional regulator [Kaistella sp.]
MDFKLTFDFNEAIYLKNPEDSVLGKKIIKFSIDLIYKIGFENFTFKKLAMEIGTTEASVYRYFENKYRLLLYITNWYWFYINFIIDFRLQNIEDSVQKIKLIIEILTDDLPESSGDLDYNKRYLNEIVISESSKVYHVKDIDEINKSAVFQPYKELCAKIAGIFSEYNQTYDYPLSLSSTLIEASHFQQYFIEHLPRLTDVNKDNSNHFTNKFLEDLVFKSLRKN